MALKDVIAANLQALLDSGRAGLRTVKDLATSSQVSNGAVGRMRQGVAQEKIDHLEQVAEALQIQPWHLLLPGLDPKNLPPPAVSQGLAQGRFSLLALELASQFDAKCDELGVKQNSQDLMRVFEQALAAIRQIDLAGDPVKPKRSSTGLGSRT